MSRYDARVLRDAKGFLSHPGAWIQRDNAKDHGNNSVGLSSPCAIRFDAYGAMRRAADIHGADFETLRLFDRVNGIRHRAGWNDAPERTQKDVLEAFDRAIAVAEAA